MLLAVLSVLVLARSDPTQAPPLLHPRLLNRPNAVGEAPPPAAPMPPPPRRLAKKLRTHGAREPLSLVKTAVRAEAQRLYGRECGKVSIPDRAFIPIEVTGADNPEYAVSFGRVKCERWGGTSQYWNGTGGSVIQIWFDSADPARMLLEHNMQGFTPRRDGLLSMQHGGACPGGAGPNVCMVRYRWNEKDRTLEVQSRTFVDGAKVKHVPTMQYDYDLLSR